MQALLRDAPRVFDLYRNSPAMLPPDCHPRPVLLSLQDAVAAVAARQKQQQVRQYDNKSDRSTVGYMAKELPAGIHDIIPVYLSMREEDSARARYDTVRQKCCLKTEHASLQSIVKWAWSSDGFRKKGFKVRHNLHASVIRGRATGILRTSLYGNH